MLFYNHRLDHKKFLQEFLAVVSPGDQFNSVKHCVAMNKQKKKHKKAVIRQLISQQNVSRAFI